jgi:manganese/zinc/iron transport system permease protein
MKLLPEFDWQTVFVGPWTEDLSSYGWIMLMGFFVATACGLVGNYLILRRMALVGDAISHSVLPGIAVAFLVSNSRGSTAMFLGALAAGITTTIIIETIHKRTRVKQDAAIGIAFTSLFAIGVILISLYAHKVDLDQECVLYGEIAFVPLEEFVKIGGRDIGPFPVIRMGVVAALTIGLVIVFYKELLVSSFDSGLAFSLGINATVVHYGLMSMLSVVVVSAFESVGAILVIAMLIIPGATASLLTQRLPWIHLLTVLHGAISAVLGTHLSIWLECSIAGAIVVVGIGLFGLSWLFYAIRYSHWLRRLRHDDTEPPAIAEAG